MVKMTKKQIKDKIIAHEMKYPNIVNVRVTNLRIEGNEAFCSVEVSDDCGDRQFFNDVTYPVDRLECD